VWIGEKTDCFVPTRGIRQGDSLSPYLFVICMEKLFHIIADQVDACYWKPLRAGRYGPQISHLLFADDLLLFAKASIEQAHCVLHCLDMFCQASGQRINYQKTQVFFFLRMLIINLERIFDIIPGSLKLIVWASILERT